VIGVVPIPSLTLKPATKPLL